MSADTVVTGVRDDGEHRRRRGLFFAAIWLVFLTDPLAAAFQRHPGWPARAVLVATVVVFAGLYLTALALAFRGTLSHWQRAALLLALTALVVVLCVFAGQTGLPNLVFVAVAGIFLLPRTAGLLWAASLAGLAGLLPFAVLGWTGSASAAISVAIGAFASFSVLEVIRRNHELVRAHEELARLAVTEERLRFSRDLHDILGHSLTVIAVKAELAGKLMGRAPDRAGREIADIERLAREALVDVRATVAGYRGVTLAVELSHARRSLEAAGIAASLPQAIDDVPGERRELFGWVVREGVTNVLRHSGARTCAVRITPASVEIVDDGRGPAASNGAGHGLAGLRERVGTAGGTLSAESSPGGFRLHVEVPAP